MTTEYKLRNARGETSAWLSDARGIAILKAQGWELVETRTVGPPEAASQGKSAEQPSTQAGAMTGHLAIAEKPSKPTGRRPRKARR